MKLKRTSGRGHKWKKGQSCVSNPQSTKHRDAARGCFFQRLEGNSNLTQAALAEHNEALRAGSSATKSGGGVSGGAVAADNTELERQMEELSVEADDLLSAGRTFNTFATNFSTCTIPAFEKFFRTFNPGSEQHTRMLAIHAAAQEYLRESSTPETSTSYFCSLMVTLEGVKESEEDVAASLALLSRVARRVSIEVLRAKFGDFARVLEATLTHHQDAANSGLLTNAIGTLSVLLRAQGRDQWSYPSTMDLLHRILAFTVHEKPKIRKSAQYNVSAILRGSSFLVGEGEAGAGEGRASGSSNRHPAGAAVAHFCMAQLRTATETDNTKTTLHTLVLLRQVIAAFPKKQLKSACEFLLSIMQLGRVLINSCAMQALYALLASHPPPEVLPVDTNIALICALTSRGPGGAGGVPVPGKNDPQPASAWITVMTVALMNLFKLSEEQFLKHLALWCEQLVPYWQSDHLLVRTKVCESFESLLNDCLGTCEGPVKGGDQLDAILHTVEAGLSLQYQAAWGQVFRTLQVCFEVIGSKRPEAAQSCLTSLCQLMTNPQLPQRAALERAVGAAVAALGPQRLLATAPLQVTGQLDKDEATLWVLPLLKKYVKNTYLATFSEQLVPLASQCYTLLASLQEKGQEGSLLGRSYQLVERQIWAALPSFCRGAIDLQAALRDEAFARLLCDHIKHRPDTRPAIMEAIRVMVSENLSQPGLLATYAKNYLPALFNVYLTPVGQSKDGTSTVSSGQRQAALVTIRTYVQIVPPDRVEELLGQVMAKFGEADGKEEGLRRRSLLDLARTLMPHLSGPPLAALYQQVTPLLATPDHGQQKAAYRLLEELLGTDTEAAQDLVAGELDQLASLLLDQLSSAAPSSRAPRLRCMRLVLLQVKIELGEERLQALLRQVVGEAVVCCARGMSEATRRAAFLLLSEVGATLQRHLGCSGEDTVRYGMQLLLAGLVGSPSLASSSILAITAFTYQYKDNITEDMLEMLIQNTCVQLLCQSREIVSSCLSLIKSCLAIFSTARMAAHMGPVVKALCAMVPDCQRKFRLKTRDIFDRLMRKYGADHITALVPPGDTILHKRLKNLRKLAARKQREREARKSKGEASDEEEEDFTSKALPASLDEILAEIDSEEDEADDGEAKAGKDGSRKKKRKKGSTFIKEDDEKIVDLLDASAGQAIVSGHKAGRTAGAGAGRAGDGLGGFAVDKESGKLIITEDGKSEKSTGTPKMDFMEDIDEYLGLKSAAQGGKVKKRKRTESGGSAEVNEAPTGKVSVAGSSVNGAARKKRKPDPGSEFRSRKAGGDMMKKGKISPYAYVKFSKEQLNRRKKAKFEGQFGSLVRGARKGVAGGRKGRTSKGRSKK